MKSIYNSIIFVCLFIAGGVINFSCKKFLDIEPPRTDLVKETIFTSEATANAAVADIYYSLRSTIGTRISLLGSISSDESVYHGVGTNAAPSYKEIHDNAIQINNLVIARLWNDLYSTIYKTNAVIEGITTATGISDTKKQQFIGEAKFNRAFCYFYLTNLWGDVPLVLSTNYSVNNTISKSSKEDVYKQIVQDLLDAQSALPDNYSLFNNERVRANKWVATALLARVYLYLQEWGKAETQASAIIGNTSLYNLSSDLLQVFRVTSNEAIFQFWSSRYPEDRDMFFVPSEGARNGALSQQLVSNFESSDLRLLQWVQNRVIQGITYYGSRKYVDFSTPPLDYSVVLRLVEQYLVRAEARAMQGKVTGTGSAESDINVIRSRAGLANTTAGSQEEMLLAIAQERRFELFVEWGHRWFDLKRTGKAGAVLGPLKPGWQAYKELFPIPESQRISNPNITQNNGY